MTLFISAAILFLVQPMVGKKVLPLFGGSPAVWNTCMVFYQAVLLLGYLYAHKLTSLKSQKQQISIHLCVLALAGGLMALAAGLRINKVKACYFSSLKKERSNWIRLIRFCNS